MLPTLARALVTPHPHVLFLLGPTLHRVDEVGHEIGAALILVHDLGPGGLDLLVLTLDRVVAAIGQAQRGQGGQHGQDLAHQISPGGI
jgi:hypothetical protein